MARTSLGSKPEASSNGVGSRRSAGLAVTPRAAARALRLTYDQLRNQLRKHGLLPARRRP